MKYIKLYEEFDPKNIKPFLDKIGRHLPKLGHAKICFEFGRNSIIKFFQIERSNEREICNCIQQRELNLNVIPKIYKIGLIKPKGDDYFNDLFDKYFLEKGKGYVDEFSEREEVFFIIEEKIIIDENLQNELIEINNLYQKVNENSVIVSNKYNFIIDLQIDIFKYLRLGTKLKDFQKTLNINQSKIFERLVEIYKTLSINNIVISDFNFENFGYNQKGDIIAFDLADEKEHGSSKKFNEKDLDYIF